MNLNYTWCYVRSVDPLSSIPKISKKKLTAILRGPRQAPLSVEFSRQEYWSGLPCPSPDLPDPGIEPRSPVLRPVSRTAGGFLTDWATYAFFPVISERGLCGSLRVWRIYLCRPSSVSAELSWSFWIKRSLFRHLRLWVSAGRDLTPFRHLSTSPDCPTAIRIVLASSWYYPLHHQGKVSYFLIPWGERQLLSQCPKIACHSQLLGWRPSRGAQRQQESTAHVSGTPLKHQLRDAAQEDPACSEVFILFFFQLRIWVSALIYFLILFQQKPVNWKWD